MIFSVEFGWKPRWSKWSGIKWDEKWKEKKKNYENRKEKRWFQLQIFLSSAAIVSDWWKKIKFDGKINGNSVHVW